MWCKAVDKVTTHCVMISSLCTVVMAALHSGHLSGSACLRTPQPKWQQQNCIAQNLLVAIANEMLLLSVDTTEGFLDGAALGWKMACSWIGAMGLGTIEEERNFCCGGGMQWWGDLCSVLSVIATQVKTKSCKFSFSSLWSIWSTY